MLQRLVERYAAEASAVKKVGAATALMARAGKAPPAGRVRLKFAYLTSYTAVHLRPLVFAEGFRQGLWLEIYEASYEQYAAEVLNRESGLHRFQPDVVLVALAGRDLFPELHTGRGSSALERSCRERLAPVIAVLQRAARAFPMVLVAEFEAPRDTALVGYEEGWSPRRITGALNDALHEGLADSPNVRFLELDAVHRRLGSAQVFDEKLWYYGRFALTPVGLLDLARRLVPYFVAVRGLTKKCLVLDLDDTLWGGIVGEVGAAGIALSETGVGRAFSDFQQALLGLYERGILLAICSKNDEAQVLEVLRQHPAMVLREENFAAVRINWRPKSENVRAIAQDLNIGLDSIVFWDDSPVERAEVRAALPEVTVPEVPDAPEKYLPFLLDLPHFAVLRLTEEDRARGQMYRQLRSMRELQASAASPEDFLRSLAMRMRVVRNGEATMGRVAQMTQRTTQFNLSSKRYSVEDLRRLAEDATTHVFAFGLQDIFGDHGICGVAVVKKEASEYVLDTFLMSCRVIGRRAESFMLRHILDALSDDGCKRLLGTYVRSKRNGVIRSYLDETFDVLDREGDDRVTFNVVPDRLKVGDLFQVEEIA